jgi:hypothetical protein
MTEQSIENESKALFYEKRIELQTTGELAAAVEFDNDGNWIGLLLAKNFEYSDRLEQIHWAKKVEY